MFKEERSMLKVLVCDDEKDIVSALRIYLTAEGYEVLEAYTGAQALEIVRREEVHLILMDRSVITPY